MVLPRLALATRRGQDRRNENAGPIRDRNARRRIMSFSKSIVLALAYGLLIAAPALAQQPGANFPDGPGKDTVVAVCGGCHDINRVRAGYNAAGWNMLQHMMQNMGAPIAPEDWPAVTTYLTKNFPERPRPGAANIPGPAQATIKLWDVPTIG